MVQSIPADYAGVTPYLIVRDASRALQFYRDAFDATELMRLPGPAGTVGHAEIRIGGGIVMLPDESPEHRGPQSLGGTSVGLIFYVDDADASFAQAIAAGATVTRLVQDQFYGDRSGTSWTRWDTCGPLRPTWRTLRKRRCSGASGS